MTPKEKAKELFNKMFCSSRSIEVEQAKKCALIAVDEIINSRPAITDSQIEYKNYWQEVKTEIQNL